MDALDAPMLSRGELMELDPSQLAEKVIGLRNDLADDAEEIAALHQERDALADALRTERAAREAAERAIALLSRTLGCESDTPEGIVTEALDYAAEQRERAEAADDAVARAADADARSANLLMCGEAAERAAEEALARHAALAGAVRAYMAALDAHRAEKTRWQREYIPAEGVQRARIAEALAVVVTKRAALDAALAAATTTPKEST